MKSFSKGSLVRVRISEDEYAYHVRGDLRSLDGSKDFSVLSGEIAIILEPSLPTKKGWAAYVKVIFSSGKTGYISEMLLEEVA